MRTREEDLRHNRALQAAGVRATLLLALSVTATMAARGETLDRSVAVVGGAVVASDGAGAQSPMPAAHSGGERSDPAAPAQAADRAESSDRPVPPSTPEATKVSSEGPLSLKSLFPDILHDQKRIWLFPLHVMEGKHLKPTLFLGGTTALLVALDPYDEPYFRNSSGFNGYKTGPLRARNTALVITLFPLVTYLGGVAHKGSYAKETGLLSAKALADSQIASLAIKAIDGRLHPIQIPPHGDFAHTWFKYTRSAFNPGSFPSGHASGAFAVATVFATRYRAHRWVPWAAYGLATLISVSRVPDQAHFPSDVFFGAALGYAVGHLVLLRH